MSFIKVSSRFRQYLAKANIMKSITIIDILFIALFGVICLIVYRGARGAQIMACEVSVHSDYYPVVRSIEKFCEKNGHAPNDIEQLYPNYLDYPPSYILSTKSASNISYEVSEDRSEWRLIVESYKTGSRRLYISVDGIPLSEDEKKQLKRSLSCWDVLEP